jgi:signal peptidase I
MDPVHKEMLMSALRAFGKCDVVVEGESMKPFIRSGDTVTLSRKENPPRLGEVIAFFNEDQLLVHRVVWRKRFASGIWRIWVWGDSSPGMPGSVLSDEYVGKVVSITRNNRPSGIWIRFPLRIIALPAGIFLHLAHVLKKQPPK